MEVKKVVCNLCKGRCRVLLHTQNGRLVKFEEDTSFPIPARKGCVRLLAGAQEFMYHPDRLSFPLKRTGERGEGKWQVISWEQAFDEIAERLQQLKDKYGAETLAMTHGTGRNLEFECVRFANLFGTPNHCGPTTICYGPQVVMTQAMFGWSLRFKSVPRQISERREAASRCFFLIGFNPAQSYHRVWDEVRESKKLGAKVIVVDPRRTEAAELADLWLQLRPGTDTALLMSMINVIIEEGLYDREFVENWCHGFDKLRERAREYPPDKVAEIAWLPVDKIREAARMYATNRPAYSIHGMGVEHTQNGVEGVQARLILTAITGNVDVEGGECLTGQSKLAPHSELEADHMLPPEQGKKQIGANRFRLMSLPGYELIQEHIKRFWGQECGSMRSTGFAHAPSVFRTMITSEPYPVRACITVSSNPMITAADTKLVYKALKSLDLYVVLDYFPTPSAELADYVLPITSWLERPWLWNQMGIDSAAWGGEQGLPNVVPGEYDRKSDWEALRGIGIRLGQDWPWENLEQVFDYRLKPLGVTFKEFMAQGGYHFPAPEFKKYQRMGGFATPTGKVELYSTILEKLGYDPLPRYEETFENPIAAPELAKDYPLMLITGGRFEPLFHSEFRQIDSLRSRHPDPLVQINPETAANLDINDGDWVWIETQRGRIRMKCKLFSGIEPMVVNAEHGWWFPELPGEEPWLHGVWESNANVLTEDELDACNKLTGGWPLKTALCRIYKCKGY